MMAIDHIIWAEPASPLAQNGEARESEFRFIQFVFTALRGIFIQSTQEDGNSAVVDFLPFFAAQVAVQAQMARLILHLVSSKQPVVYREFVLQKLAENLKFLADFGADPTFNSKLVFSLAEFLFHKESHIYAASTSVVNFIISRQKSLFKDLFLEPKSFDVLLSQTNMAMVQFTPTILLGREELSRRNSLAHGPPQGQGAAGRAAPQDPSPPARRLPPALGHCDEPAAPVQESLLPARVRALGLGQGARDPLAGAHPQGHA